MGRKGLVSDEMVSEGSVEIQLLVHGIELEETYEGRLFSVEKYEVISTEEPIPNCVKINYEDSIKADPPIPKQDYIDREIPRAVDLFTQSLSLLLEFPSTLISYEATLDGVAVVPKTHLYGSNLYNIADVFNRDYTTRGLSTSPSGDFWGILENTISSYRQMTDNVGQARLTLALRWFQKGINESDISDRLVAFWISFNALYAYLKTHGEQKAIKDYICKNVDLEMAQYYVNSNGKGLENLSQLPTEKLPILLRGGTGEIEITKCLAELLKPESIKSNTQNYIKIVKKTVLSIYAIRNNLFHGDYDPVSEDARKHIVTAVELLSPLIRGLLFKEMTGKPLTKTIFSRRCLQTPFCQIEDYM